MIKTHAIKATNTHHNHMHQVGGGFGNIRVGEDVCYK